MKRDSLVAKLLFTFTVIIGISFIIIATILSFWFKEYYFEQRKEHFDNDGQLVAKAAVAHLNQQKNANLNSLISTMNFVSNSVQADILVTDNLGYVYEVTNPQHNDLKFTMLDIKKMSELKNGNSVEEKSTENKKFSDSEYIYYKPMFQDGYFSGVIVMVTKFDKVQEPLNKVYAIIWISAILALICSSIIIYYFSEKILIVPLSQINTAAKKLAKGDIGNRVVIKSNDEIGELAESFNVMADSLEQVENTRREFISNVSHELRTPITSIKGFIAGILDGVIPKDKENYYLDIAYNEIQRLTRLVNDLLDISTMQAGKLKIDFSEVDINGIIKNCVTNMEQKIKDKKIKAEIVLENQHLFVLGDRDRLIQVVMNLLDNAIKYSNDGGVIKIVTRSRGSKVFVDVYNDGPALSVEEINCIWDRFYKSDKSRTNKVSTGLGLPIVRQILAQHGEDIWVENKTKDYGVTFTFSLKKVT